MSLADISSSNCTLTVTIVESRYFSFGIVAPTAQLPYTVSIVNGDTTIELINGHPSYMDLNTIYFNYDSNYITLYNLTPATSYTFALVDASTAVTATIRMTTLPDIEEQLLSGTLQTTTQLNAQLDLLYQPTLLLTFPNTIDVPTARLFQAVSSSINKGDQIRIEFVRTNVPGWGGPSINDQNKYTISYISGSNNFTFLGPPTGSYPRSIDFYGCVYNKYISNTGTSLRIYGTTPINEYGQEQYDFSTYQEVTVDDAIVFGFEKFRVLAISSDAYMIQYVGIMEPTFAVTSTTQDSVVFSVSYSNALPLPTNITSSVGTCVYENGVATVSNLSAGTDYTIAFSTTDDRYESSTIGSLQVTTKKQLTVSTVSTTPSIAVFQATNVGNAYPTSLAVASEYTQNYEPSTGKLTISELDANTPYSFSFATEDTAFVGSPTQSITTPATIVAAITNVSSTESLKQLLTTLSEQPTPVESIAVTNYNLAAVVTSVLPTENLSNVSVTFISAPSGSVTIAPTVVNSIVYFPGEVGNTYTITAASESISVTVASTGISVNNTTYTLGDTVSIGSKQFKVVATGSFALKYLGEATPTPTPQSVPCFLADAPVLTPSGYKPIGSLSVGDEVQTADGRVVQIVEVCRYSVAAAKSTRPFVIPQGRFGATQDLHISPRHRVLVEDGSLVEALRIPDLQQDTSIDGTIEYYNLELPDWQQDRMVVAGVTVESKAQIERLTVTPDEFKALLYAKYGKITPALLEQASHSCRVVAGGFIEVPLIRRK